MKSRFWGHLFGSVLFACTVTASAVTGRVEKVTVRTRAPWNAAVRVPYRVPARYDASRRDLYRVLALFGGRNTDGRADVGGRLGWGEWEDKEGIFIVCPGFKSVQRDNLSLAVP